MDHQHEQPHQPQNDAPSLCIRNCGFFGYASSLFHFVYQSNGCGRNPVFGNMCSKCFKESAAQNQSQNAKNDNNNNFSVDIQPTDTTINSDTINSDTINSDTIKSDTAKSDTADAAVAQDVPPTGSQANVDERPGLAAEVEPPQDERPVQKNKDRCFCCRAKLTIAKQISNKCRCDYIFCDQHRLPDKHNCDFDHRQRAQQILNKQNPKLHDRKTGGTSFTRID